MGRVGVGRMGVQGLFHVSCVVGWDSSWRVAGGRDGRLLSFVGNELFWKGVLCYFIQVGGAVCMEVVTE